MHADNNGVLALPILDGITPCFDNLIIFRNEQCLNLWCRCCSSAVYVLIFLSFSSENISGQWLEGISEYLVSICNLCITLSISNDPESFIYFFPLLSYILAWRETVGAYSFMLTSDLAQNAWNSVYPGSEYNVATFPSSYNDMISCDFILFQNSTTLSNVVSSPTPLVI